MLKRFAPLFATPLLVAVGLLISADTGVAQGGAPAAPPTASSVLSPALAQLRDTLGGLRLDKWKAPGPVREQASGNIGSITRDLDATLPGLLAAADAAPGTVSRNLPVFRNVDALYDVLLRVVETADLSAPDSEADRLHTALAALEDARRSLGDAVESAAVSQEQQIGSLHEQVRTLNARTQAEPVAEEEEKKPAVVHKHKASPKEAYRDAAAVRARPLARLAPTSWGVIAPAAGARAGGPGTSGLLLWHFSRSEVYPPRSGRQPRRRSCLSVPSV